MITCNHFQAVSNLSGSMDWHKTITFTFPFFSHFENFFWPHFFRFSNEVVYLLLFFEKWWYLSPFYSLLKNVSSLPFNHCIEHKSVGIFSVQKPLWHGAEERRRDTFTVSNNCEKFIIFPSDFNERPPATLETNKSYRVRTVWGLYAQAASTFFSLMRSIMRSILFHENCCW